MALTFFVNSSTHKERRLRVLATEEMSVDMSLDRDSREIYSGFQCLRGNVSLSHLNPKNPGEWDFVFLRVQLEGVATGILKGADGATTEKVEKFLYPDGNAGNPDSHLAHYLIKPSDKKEARVIAKGQYNFPFAIQLQGENFPASYTGPYGRIEYTLITYVGLKSGPVIEAVEKRIRTKGHYNLAVDPSLSQKIVLNKRKDTGRGVLSFFAPLVRNCTVLEVRLILNQRGFISGEDMNIILQIDNPEHLTIKNMSATFVQRMVNCVGASKKFTAAVLQSKEVEVNIKDEKIQWEAEIKIPENLLPTFSRERKTLEILYFLQFLVDAEGGSPDSDGGNETQVKGETMIVIGTHRDEECPKSPQSSKEGEEMGKCFGLGHEWDCASSQNFETIPVAYSSQRRRSSTDSLPSPQ